ncbi:unnamed protein product [Auanema sp. JU1783]|nr:unnamed protein product [Auanema sp. JU1783]
MSRHLIVLGITIHLILVYSIFDIYYTSPIVTNVKAHDITKGEAPAKRLVVFSADGLRLDSFTHNPELSPFLHSIIRERKGVSGISVSHVPTESRPGHVAIFAGFAEDVSAVAKGWKKNPVPFDSVLNRSAEAFLFGSPDIVSLFDDKPHVHSFSYAESDEDFGSTNAYKLDEWVFEKITSYLNTSSSIDTSSGLSDDRKVFFLHLLGLDTNGHGSKPHSERYKHNIEVVDRGISKINSLFSHIFNDERTAFVFTSDHGMTDWGSHGAGSDEEVLTPFVAWGAGIKNGGARVNIAQVDLAPLMSSLIGVSIPVNSVGILPTKVLSVSPKYLFQCSLANFLQLKEQIFTLRSVKANRFFFKDFPEFGDVSLQSLEKEMLKLGQSGRYAMAASLFVDKAPLMKEAIYYYHRYDRGFLGAAISTSFLLWITLVWCFLTRSQDLNLLSKKVLVPNKYIISAMGLTCGMCFLCGFPISNYVYVILPFLILSVIENMTGITGKTVDFIKQVPANYQTMSFDFLVRPFIACLSLVFIVFIFVMVFMDRRLLSFIFLLLIFLPNLYTPNDVIKEWTKVWRCSCVSLMPFPFLATVGKYEYPILCITTPAVIGFLLFKSMKSSQSNYRESWYLVSACFFTSLHIFLTTYLVKTNYLLGLFSWLTLPSSFIFPLFSDLTITQRVICYLVSLYLPYCMLSIAYESTFTLLFMPLLLLFLRMEFQHMNDSEFLRISAMNSPPMSKAHGRVHPNEMRRAVVCVAFVLAALFGTGNFASLNSFNPSSLTRFVTIFSPFIMASLLIIKLIIPVLMVTLVFASVLRFDRRLIQRLSCLVLIITDLMAMCFFHQLKDSGSWLDIGMSISQYIFPDDYSNITKCFKVFLG